MDRISDSYGVKQTIQRWREWSERFGTAFRVLAALLCLVTSYIIFPMAAGLPIHLAVFVLLLALGLLILAAVMLAPPIARGLVEWAYDRLTYSEKYRHAPPMYGRPQSLRKSRRYEEAMKAYEEIAEDYPDELKPYLEMIDIALSDLKDPDRAELIYRRGVLEFEDAEDRKRLAQRLSGLRLG
ncbi:MAG: hypothetical protein R3242_05370 [Akkermansiaceae bacterium]|nr:hypothetical protein [Akkermansiaceae bacterium]